MKPTPAQAVMLREMSVDGRYARALTTYKDKIYRAILHEKHSWKTIKTLNGATFRALITRGWIAKIKDKLDYGSEQYRITQSGREVLATLSDDDFVRKGPDVTARDIIEALQSHYLPPEWIFFPELRFGTGYGHRSEKRLDAWAMNCWPSKDLVKLAFEIKVYRSDFLKELKDPNKRQAALSISNEFYFVAPIGLIKRKEVPDECGLMAVTRENIKVIKRAPHREVSHPSWLFVASLGRRVFEKVE